MLYNLKKSAEAFYFKHCINQGKLPLPDLIYYHWDKRKLTKELINEDINGNAAIYTVQVSSTDKALTKITWVTESKEYSLSMNKNASKDEKLKENFINLARSLPSETGSFSAQNLSDNLTNTNDSSRSIAVEPPAPQL